MPDEFMRCIDTCAPLLSSQSTAQSCLLTTVQLLSRRYFGTITALLRRDQGAITALLDLVVGDGHVERGVAVAVLHVEEEVRDMLGVREARRHHAQAVRVL